MMLRLILVGLSFLFLCYAGDTSTSTLPCATVVLHTLPAQIKLVSSGTVKETHLNFTTGSHSGTEAFLIPYETDTSGPYTMIHANNLAEKIHAMTVNLNVTIHYTTSGTCSATRAGAIQIFLANGSPVTDYFYFPGGGTYTEYCTFQIVVPPGTQHFYRAVAISLPPSGCTITIHTDSHYTGKTADC
jgi:hypothetical protein